MVAKQAVVAAGGSPPRPAAAAAAVAPPIASPTSRIVRFEDEQSMSSTLPSLGGTDGSAEDDAMDDDHYFRQQDAALDPPASLGRRAVQAPSAPSSSPPSPLSEFLQVKKQLASMSQPATAFTADALGNVPHNDGVQPMESPAYRKSNAGAIENHVTEEQAAKEEYVNQLRARLPQAGNSGRLASSPPSSPKRDMRKRSNRLREAGLSAAKEDASLLSEEISTMEKQIADITSRERARPDPSSWSSSSSSSSESSSSQIAECVRDISPPPMAIRDVGRREPLEIGEGKGSRTATGREREMGLRKNFYEDDTIFDSLPSAVNIQGGTDKSVATEDDHGLLHFMATSSVPSISPHSSPRDEGQPKRVGPSDANRSSASAALNAPPAAFSEGHRQRDRSVPSSFSGFATEPKTVSNEGFNHDTSNRDAPTRPVQGRTKESQEKFFGDDRAHRDRWADKRTKSGHSSFSRGDFSTPSDGRPQQLDAEERIISGNVDLDSLNAVAALHVEVRRCSSFILT